MFIQFIQWFPKSYQYQKVTIIFRFFINFTLEKDTLKCAGPRLLPMEVMQEVIGHVYFYASLLQ